MNQNADGEMSFLEHLQELRVRLLWSVVAVVVFAALSFTFAREIIAFMMGPLEMATQGMTIRPELHFTSITEPLFQSFKIALFAGIFFAFPFWFWQLWLFIAPGLFEKERKLVRPIILSASLLFLTGSSFAYYLAVPTAYRFLLIYANPQKLQPAPKAPKRSGLVFEWHPASKAKQTAPPTSKPTKPSKSTKLSKSTKPTKTLAPTKPPGVLSFDMNAKRKPKGVVRWTLALPPKYIQQPQKLLQDLQKKHEIHLTFRHGPNQAPSQLRILLPVPGKAGGLGLKPILTLQAYLNVSSWFLLGFGVVFQTPLVIFLLIFVGLVTPELLARYRRHAFVAILAISAVLTPTGDPINLMMMAIPMYVLYEIGLFASRVLLKDHVPLLAVPPDDDDDDDDDDDPPDGGTPPTTPSDGTDGPYDEVEPLHFTGDRAYHIGPTEVPDAIESAQETPPKEEAVEEPQAPTEEPTVVSEDTTTEVVEEPPQDEPIKQRHKMPVIRPPAEETVGRREAFELPEKDEEEEEVTPPSQTPAPVKEKPSSDGDDGDDTTTPESKNDSTPESEDDSTPESEDDSTPPSEEK